MTRTTSSLLSSSVALALICGCSAASPATSTSTDADTRGSPAADSSSPSPASGAALCFAPTAGPAVARVTATATFGSFAYAASSNGLYRSSDLVTWDLVFNAIGIVDVSAIVVFNGALYVALPGRVLHTTDGVSWTDAGAGITDNYTISAFATDGTSLVAIAEGYVHSYDAPTNSWTPIPFAEGPAEAIGVENGIIYASSFYKTGVYQLTDSTDAVVTGLSTAWGYKSLLFHNGVALAGNSDTIFERGATGWTAAFTPGASVNALFAQGTALFAATDAGFFVSTDGHTWKAGPPATFAQAMAFSSFGNDVIAANGPELATFDGTNWTTATLALSVIDKIQSTDGSIFARTTSAYGSPEYISQTLAPQLFASIDYGTSFEPQGNTSIAITDAGVFKLQNGSFFYGASLETLAPITLPSSVTLADLTYPIVSGTSKAAFLSGASWQGTTYCNDGTSTYVGSGAFLRTTDGGQTWKNVTAGLPTLAPDCRGEATYPEIDDVLESGDLLFAISREAGTFVSRDAGSTWTHADSLGAYDGITHVASFGGAILAGTSAGLFTSSDDGATWAAVSGITGSVGDVVVAPDGSIYASVSGTEPAGIYRSIDGVTWSKIDRGLTRAPGALHIANGTIYAAVGVQGIFKAALSGCP